MSVLKPAVPCSPWRLKRLPLALLLAGSASWSSSHAAEVRPPVPEGESASGQLETVTVTVSSCPLALSPLCAGAEVSAAWLGNQLALPASNSARGRRLSRQGEDGTAGFDTLISGSGIAEYAQLHIL